MEIVHKLARMFLDGAALRTLRQWLIDNNIPNKNGEVQWTVRTVETILTDEKNCGDVLMQKTFRSDCISRKTIKNTGQLPMYLIQDHHEAIIDRDIYNAVQAEFARRNALKTYSKYAPTGKGCYSSRYALTERMVCGECGTPYRRVTWTREGFNKVVWRCVSRLNHGKKYCKNSPTMDEGPLQRAIMTAINRVMSERDILINRVREAMQVELAPTPTFGMSLADIERRLEQINAETRELIATAARSGRTPEVDERLRELLNETTHLKEKRAAIEAEFERNSKTLQRIEEASSALDRASPEMTEWDEPTIRRLVEQVKVLTADRIEVYLKGGVVIEQEVIRE